MPVICSDIVGASLGTLASGVSSISMQLLKTRTTNVSKLVVDITVGGVIVVFGNYLKWWS